MRPAPAPASANTAPASTLKSGSLGRRSSLAPWLALAAVLVFGAAQTAMRFHNHHLGLIGDDYDFLLGRHTITFHTLLQPHNENLSAVGVLLYRAIFAVVGISTAVPYIALLLISTAACVTLAYVFLRRELGPWIALIPALVLATLGPAAEALLWPFEFTLFSALAFWLGAMLLAGKGGTRNDALACLLLVLAIGSQSLAVALLPATVLALLLWSGWRGALRRAWVAGVPLVLYVAWYAVYHPQLERTLEKVPSFIVDSFVASVGDITAAGYSAGARVLAVVVLILALARCVHLRRVPTTTIYMALGLLCVWVATGLSEGEGRVPAESRYQFHNALLLMLALAPLVPRVRLSTRAAMRTLQVAAVTGVALVIVVSNLGRYSFWEHGFERQESIANAELAALEVARPALLTPDEVFTGENEPGLYWPFTPRSYLSAAAAHGSPVNVRRDLEFAGPLAKAQADAVLMRLEGIEARPGSAPAGRVAPLGVRALLLPAGPGCGVIPAGAARAGFEVFARPGGLNVSSAPGPPVALAAARFSERPEPGSLRTQLGGTEILIEVNRDASRVPWRISLTASQALTVCSLPG